MKNYSFLVIFIHLLILNNSQLPSVKNIKKYNFQNLLQTILKQAKNNILYSQYFFVYL